MKGQTTVKKLIFVSIVVLMGCAAKQSTTNNLSYDFKTLFDTTHLEHVTAGNLSLPTGKIVAGDPFYVKDNKPFNVKVTPGTYPVELLIYKVEEDHHRVAFAKIKFSDDPATEWTLALTEDISRDDIDSLQQGEFFGYGVDAGMGCFLDSETNAIFSKAIEQFYQNNPDSNYYDDVLADEFSASMQHPLSRDPGDWVNHMPVKGDSHNVIIFASGWGDGFYPTYWGKNAKGEIVELITDFLVVAQEE